jgi:isopentenyl-diphosphate delta-isomerase
MPEVILVNEADLPVGREPKLTAHQNGGKLHRAFSIFIVNQAGEMLLQRRSQAKYHFGGLWTNACCGHPQPGRDLVACARQRLREEFGFDTNLRELFSFIYRAADPGSGLTEHEFDHVLLGRFDGLPHPAAGEIDDWKWAVADELLRDVTAFPQHYTPWFCLTLGRVLQALPAKD